jgi:hypothetical protein
MPADIKRKGVFHNEKLGLTGIMDMYFTMSTIDWNLFSLRIGISAKF